MSVIIQFNNLTSCLLSITEKIRRSGTFLPVLHISVKSVFYLEQRTEIATFWEQYKENMWTYEG